jgi:hypothetical protein
MNLAKGLLSNLICAYELPNKFARTKGRFAKQELESFGSSLGRNSCPINLAISARVYVPTHRDKNSGLMC